VVLRLGPLYSVTVPARAARRGGVVLLHGFGADERDLLGLAPDLGEDLAYVAVRAPFAVPWGGYAWYPMAAPPSPDRAMAAPDETTAFRSAVARVAELLQALPARCGLDPGRTVLAGFSQGAAVTAGVLAHGTPELAGYAILSGYLHPAAALPAALTGRPVFIGHGDQDDLLPVGLARAARDRLQQLGAQVTYREYPTGHSLCPEELADLQAWLAAVLPPCPPGNGSAPGT
jgi:phospholipase/carboxylesterase